MKGTQYYLEVYHYINDDNQKLDLVIELDPKQAWNMLQTWKNLNETDNISLYSPLQRTVADEHTIESWAFLQKTKHIRYCMVKIENR